MTEQISLRHELIRKGIHVAALWFPAAYLALPRATMLWISGASLIFALFVEFLRFFWPRFTIVFLKAVGMLLRNHESRSLTGSTYMLIGIFFSILFFEQWVAIAAISLLCISDALASLVGRKWGKVKLMEGRTFEGSMIFLISGLILVLMFPELPRLVGITGVFAALIIDLMIRKLNDNLTIPLGSGFVMQMMIFFY